jgi:hypothetical protein
MPAMVQNESWRGRIWLPLLVATFATGAVAQTGRDLKVTEYEKQLHAHCVEMAGIYVNIAFDAHKAGLVPTASTNYLRAAEVGKGQHQMADQLLGSMRALGDKFWRKPRKVSSQQVAQFARRVREADRVTRKSHLNLARLALGIDREDDAREHCLQAIRLGAEVSVDPKGTSKLDKITLPDALAKWLLEQTVQTASGERVFEAAAGRGLRLQGLQEQRSEQLVVRTDLDARQCQQLHALGMALLPHLEARLEGTSPRQLVLLVFGKRADYDAYLKSLGIASAGAGLAEYGSFQTIVCAEGKGDGELQSLILHELSHLFFFGTAPAAMPDWYAEGFAESFGGQGTFAWDGKVLTMGALMQRERLQAAQAALLPLRELLAADAETLWRTDRDKAVQFYTQAWAFQRFLRSADCPWREDFDAFEAQCRGGALGAVAGKAGDRKPAQTLFDERFGKQLDAIEKAFHAFLKKL